MSNNINFAKWLGRMGMTRPDEPEVIHAIQPVMVVQDTSQQVSPAFGPRAMAGELVAAVAFEKCSAILEAVPDGGVLAKCTVTTDVDALIMIDVNGANIVGSLNNVLVAPTENSDDSMPASSFLTTGTAVFTIGRSQLHVKAREPLHIPSMYVSKGRFLMVSCPTPEVECGFLFQWTEFSSGPKSQPRP